mmetsp:Transcript_5028/g.11338  ORF Transcript_5028/g.11338 Transcript_5028/m.11338 type:complete len:235 (-) Transcript_5028:815-1519(-)
MDGGDPSGRLRWQAVVGFPSISVERDFLLRLVSRNLERELEAGQIRPRPRKVQLRRFQCHRRTRRGNGIRLLGRSDCLLVGSRYEPRTVADNPPLGQNLRNTVGHQVDRVLRRRDVPQSFRRENTQRPEPSQKMVCLAPGMGLHRQQAGRLCLQRSRLWREPAVDGSDRRRLVRRPEGLSRPGQLRVPARFVSSVRTIQRIHPRPGRVRRGIPGVLEGRSGATRASEGFARRVL